VAHGLASRETRGCRPCRALNVFDQPAETIAFGKTDSHRRIKNLFGDLGHAMKQCSAAGQHHATRELSLPTSVFDLIGDVHQNFFRTRLKDVAKNLSRQLSRRASTD